MAFSDIQAKECLCAWVQQIEPIKNEVNGVLTSSIVLLQAAKALIALYPANLEDKINLVLLQTTLALLEKPIASLETPFAILLATVAPFADCPPTASLAQVLKNVRNTVLSSVDEFRYEVEQYIASLDDNVAKIAQLDRWITLLQEIQSAITDCKSI